MEQWSAGEDDRPYTSPAARSASPWLWLLVVVAVSALAWWAVFWSRLPPERGPAPARPEPLAIAPTQQPPAPAEQPAPARHPLRAEAAAPLPDLEQSDPLLRRSIAGLVGKQAFDELVLPQALVRRIVATVDNLPRATAPARALPLNPVPGTFLMRPGAGGETIVDPANADRYTPYVRVFERIVPSALVLVYVRAYPLFQRAYEELGYPGRYFNDRLMEAIDDLLLAPESDAPLRLQRGRVLYEFADPDLETRSAGQKILLRMGPDNARRVKAQLWRIRRELLKAGGEAGSS